MESAVGPRASALGPRASEPRPRASASDDIRRVFCGTGNFELLKIAPGERHWPTTTNADFPRKPFQLVITDPDAKVNGTKTPVTLAFNTACDPPQEHEIPLGLAYNFASLVTEDASEATYLLTWLDAVSRFTGVPVPVLFDYRPTCSAFPEIVVTIYRSCIAAPLPLSGPSGPSGPSAQSGSSGPSAPLGSCAIERVEVIVRTGTSYRWGSVASDGAEEITALIASMLGKSVDEFIKAFHVPGIKPTKTGVKRDRSDTKHGLLKGNGTRTLFISRRETCSVCGAEKYGSAVGARGTVVSSGLMLCTKCARAVTSLTVLGSSYRVEGKHIVPIPGLAREIPTDDVALAVLLSMQRIGRLGLVTGGSVESVESDVLPEPKDPLAPMAPMAPMAPEAMALARLIRTLPIGLIGPALVSKKRKLQVEANLRILLTTRHSAIVSDPECVTLCDRLKRQKARKRFSF